MSKLEVNTVAPQCGTTLTLGESGDTVTLGTGASQSGFGRAGSVDWQTGDIKTGTFTAASGKGYFCNTTASAFTCNLPSSPSAGDIVGIRDYANTFNTYNLTIGRGGSNLEGNAGDKVCDDRCQEFLMVYVDGTQGWIAVSSGTGSIGISPTFISASGGNCVTTSGDYKIHKFTGPGTFTVCSVGNPAGSTTVSYVVVAGGGGGAGANGGGGGGGAGGFRESKAASDSYTASPLNATSGPGYNLPVSATGYPIVVGGGGAGHPGSPPCADGGNGNLSSFSTISSAAGGGGSGVLPATADAGGSGGGAGGPGPATQAGGLGNTPPVSPAQGTAGGSVPGSPANNQGAGGGGAGGAGEDALPEGKPGGIPGSYGGNGGLGVTSEITASPVGYAGGGGGNQERSSGVGAGKGGAGPQPAPTRNTTPGAGGLGDFGAANGAFGNGFPGNNTNGTANLGGGGGGVDTPQSGNAGNGGSGVVIIRYKYQ